MDFPSNYRKMSVWERRDWVMENLDLSQQEKTFFNNFQEESELADIMVENALGFVPIPMGVVPNVKLGEKNYNIPLATEEPSVIAAATYAFRILSKASWDISPPSPLTKGQIFISSPRKISFSEEELLRLQEEMHPEITPMTQRGGGFQDWEIHFHHALDTLEVSFWIDSRDSMGANLVNTLAEKLTPLVEDISQGSAALKILSNTGNRRVATAKFSLPIKALRSASKDPQAHVTRLVLASQLAWEIADRAITNNKGIMNGVSALALASGNDTRAVEAAAHAFASRDGSYRSLSKFYLEGENLVGKISLPVPFGTVGGAISSHPSFQITHKLLGNPTGPELGALAAALGLAQNFAALLALTGQGIQKGHMSLHARRVSYLAGARGDEIALISGILSSQGDFRIENARVELAKLKNQ